jgi:hypothetical protein
MPPPHHVSPPDQQASALARTNPPLSQVERAALAIAGAGSVGFAVYGFATGAPSTVAYPFIVAVGGALIIRFRREPIPGALAIALAVLAVAHLAGGLVRVDHDVLYNASFGSPALRYDHFVHASGIFVGTLLLWTLYARGADPEGNQQPDLLLACVLAGLGLGAINETIEFLTTLANHGSHVGGYANTGWDLVSNVVGGTGAGLVISKTRQCAKLG